MTDPLGVLKQALRAGTPPAKSTLPPLPDNPDPSYAVARFLISWSHAGSLGADQVVLLRQALRWLNSSPVMIGAPPPNSPDFQLSLLQAEIGWSLSGHLSTSPFTPPWLNESPRCDDRPVERALDEGFHAEAFLKSVGCKRWLSPAQKEAAWFTLHAPAGSTGTIVLPTGSGKSLCFQLLARFSSGLTVVVVPTIALAIDQQENAKLLFASYPDVNPVYFAADDDPEATLHAVKEKRTRLLFTSPEACVSGRLRPILDSFATAASGWLTNLVVDEAHLIETWGAQFRVEFQLLAATRRAWLADSGGTLRTFLFSATMTERCRNMLGQMFSEESVSRTFVCQRIRPEIRYYSHQFHSKAERDAAVLTAFWHLPRPAILYVTEQNDAETFASQFRSVGFSRLDTFHGNTGWSARRDILRRWKQHELDLIIATSAFGVGVDKRDVRAIVHACHPENLDRYYQEVGRGGRDGWTAVGLLLTSPTDRKVAEGITVNLLTPEKIQVRWEAMLQRAEYRDHLQYALPLGSRQTALLGTRTYRENIRWNKRLLLQLERAQMLRFLGLTFRPASTEDDEPEEWAVVQLDFIPTTPHLASLIKAQRDEEAAYFLSGLGQLDELLANQFCSARVIAKLYGIASDQRACPGCPRCRRETRIPLDCEPLAFPDAIPAQQNRPSAWVEGLPSYLGAANHIRFVDAISRSVTNKGIRQFSCSAEHFEPVLSCFCEAFPANTVELHRLDRAGPGTHISTTSSLPLAFLHFGIVNEHAIALGRHFPSVHLFSGAHTNDGRDVAVNEGFSRWTFEAWLSASIKDSLPCLPTTL
jgi:ATP-dependent DNA helicase RecQ